MTMLAEQLNQNISNQIQNAFEKNGYVYLQGVLEKEKCAKLTDRMFKLCEEGKLTKDDQCPLSDSIYGDVVLDDILQQLAAPLSEHIGRELVPTYTYARIYRPGEILKRHIDRESCELSATVTLGHDPESEIWPIFFTMDPKDVVGSACSIDVGDLVFYKGNELTHWRPAYRGRWQVQLFFHYVDKNGPYGKTHAFDQRPALGLDANTKGRKLTDKPEGKEDSILERMENEMRDERTVVNQPTVSENSLKKLGTIYTHDPLTAQPLMVLPRFQADEVMPGAFSFHKNFKPDLAFSTEECQSIVDMGKNMYPTKATVGTEREKGSGEGNYKSEIRRVDQYGLKFNKENKWIFDKIAVAVKIANVEHFDYELLGITHELQLLNYKEDEQGFYDWHVDCGNGEAHTRKISVVVMLSNPSDYEGGELLINNFGVNSQGNSERGAVNMFPSFLLHRVNPVTKGDRWVLVSWIHGTERFR